MIGDLDEMRSVSIARSVREGMSVAWSQAQRAFTASAPRTQLPKSVRVVEVGPRDGLQNEPQKVSTEVKVQLVEDLANAGLRNVEVTGFVSPRYVPQLADAYDVMRSIKRRSDTAYPVLVPNMKGFEKAVEAGAQEVAVIASATEQFSLRNINCTIKESLYRFGKILDAAGSRNIKVRGYVSCIAGCPYEGSVDPADVARVARALHNMGCYEISLGDTIGVGTPASIVTVIEAVVKCGVPVDALAIHCHDTRGTALANVLAAMLAGVRVVDSSIAGLGGCPFAPGAAGNLATEDLVYMLRGMNIDVGPVDLDRLISIGDKICAHLGRPSSSKVANASSCADTRSSTGNA